MCVNVPGLIPGAGHQCLRGGLKDLLQFSRIGRQLTRIGELRRALRHADDLAGREALRRYQDRGIGIFLGECILQAAHQEQRVDSRTPFAMVAGEEVRVLVFCDAEGAAGCSLVIILKHVAGTIISVVDLQEERVLRGDLLFEPGREVEGVQIVVRPLSVVGAVVLIERETGVAEVSILRSVLQPGAAARVFGIVVNSKVILFEQP